MADSLLQQLLQWNLKIQKWQKQGSSCQSEVGRTDFVQFWETDTQIPWYKNEWSKGHCRSDQWLYVVLEQCAGVLCAWSRGLLQELFPSAYHFHSTQAGRGGEFNNPLHGCGTHEANAHGLAVLYCIRENHAMYILPPNSDSLSVMYILVEAGGGVSGATAVSITAGYERLGPGIPSGVEISRLRLRALLQSPATSAGKTVCSDWH